MEMRRELRLYLALTVRVSEVDIHGQSFEQDATTIDVTGTGARLKGITHTLQTGCSVLLQHRGSRGIFSVKWVGKLDTKSPGQIGLKFTDKGRFNWGRAIPQIPGDAFPDQETCQENDIKYFR